MIDACPDSAVLFFDVDGTLTSFDPDSMTDKDFSAVRPSQTVIEAFPDSAIADAFRNLAQAMMSTDGGVIPAPLSEDALENLYLESARKREAAYDCEGSVS